MPDLSEATPPSRYDRFRAIMEAAAGASTASYMSHPRFWNLPLPELRAFELYGIAMMRGGDTAPAAAKPSSCCHGSCEAQGTAASPGNGDNSGLVRGLRGQYPFDGTQFPPLPWGGKRVSEADIAFISQWINDGCPGPDEDKRHAGAPEASAVTRALVTGDAPHALFTGPTNQLAHDSGGVRARKNVAYLS